MVKWGDLYLPKISGYIPFSWRIVNTSIEYFHFLTVLSILFQAIQGMG